MKDQRGRRGRYGELVMAARMLLVALGLAACGGASELEPGAEECPISSDDGCAQPRGLYETTYVERAGGTCGAKETVRAEAVPHRVHGFGEPCSGFVEWSDDFCMASFEASCPEDEVGPGFYNRQVSNTTYTSDGLSRTGVYELEILAPDGTVHCASTYDLETASLSCAQP